MDERTLILDAVGQHIYAFMAATERYAVMTSLEVREVRKQFLQQGLRDYREANPEQITAALNQALQMLAEIVQEQN